MSSYGLGGTCKLALLLLTFLAPIHSVKADLIYSNDFQGTVGSEWSATTVTTAPLDPNRKFLGEFGNGTVSLTLASNLFQSAGTYRLEFDAMILRSWDGIFTNDNFIVSAGGSTLLDTSFSNNTNSPPFDRQRFSRGNTNGNFDARTGADENNTLGFQFSGTRDSVYYFRASNGFTFNYDPSSGPLTISFRSTQDGPIAGDESWGIDNVFLSSVPEPSSLLLVGMPAIAAILRRRR